MSRKYSGIAVVIAVVVVAAGAFYVFSGQGRKVGPYVYIRKAYKYIEEEKYKKAMVLLHKAYEELPTSEKIRENLIYGYIKYAGFHVRKKELDHAIVLLSMAHEMDESNVTVIHNLARVYCGRAVQLSKGRKFASAIECLQKATDLAVKSKKVRKSISNYLFNNAVNAYNEGDGNTLLLCLNTSYMLKPNFETLDLLGEYYYKEFRLERAKFYWEKASVLRPEDSVIRGKIEKAGKEMLLKEKMREIETPHFNVQLYREYGIDPELLKDMLVKIYGEVGKDLNFYPPSNTLIIFYNEKDFRDIFKQTGIVRAFYDGNIRMVFTSSGGPALPVVIAHEYTHVVISMLTGNKCPVWLHEGIAVFQQARYMSVPLEHVKSAVERGENLSIEMLEKGFASFDKEAVLALSYEGAYTAVSFIVDKWGWTGLRGLLRRIKEGRHYANAIDEEFYISVKVFEKMWNEHLNYISSRD